MPQQDTSEKTSPILLVRGDVESLLSALILEQEHASNLRLLCQSCHKDATAAQREGGSMIRFDPFASYLPGALRVETEAQPSRIRGDHSEYSL